MKINTDFSSTMLAPCGVTCAVCYVYLRDKKPCPGCRGQDASKPAHCQQCKIKNCVNNQEIDFCSECPSFPCETIKRLDTSYRKRYRVSLIDNLVHIQAVGTGQHLREEKAKWTCAHCGGILSLHDRICSECGKEIEHTA